MILGVNPDLYGPFWITVTLIFTIGISGNLANFLHHDHNSAYHWKYNFHLVSYAATCIIFYVCLLPMVIWGVLKWSVNTNDDSNPDLESVSSILCLNLLIKFLKISFLVALHPQPSLADLSLWIFPCRLRPRFNFVDNSNKLSSMAFSDDWRFLIRICFSQ